VPLVKVAVLTESIDSASASWTVPVNALTVIGHPKVTPLLVMVCVPRLANVIVPAVLEEVTPVPNFQSPYTNGALVLVVNVMALVRADASNVPMFHAALIVIVPVTLFTASSNTAVSCANGKLLMSGTPPDPGAQAVALQF
jgi:hypothetical protein